MIMKHALLTLTTLVALAGCTSMEALVDVPAHNGSASITGYETETHQRSVHIFDPVSLDEKIATQKLTERVSQLVILIDRSNALPNSYRDVPFDSYLREIARRYVSSLPTHIQAEVSLMQINNRGTVENIPAGAARESLLDQLANPSKIAIAGENLNTAIERIGSHFKETDGDVGVGNGILLISNWEQITPRVLDTIDRAYQYSQFESGKTISNGVSNWQTSKQEKGLCFYLVGVGNRMSRTLADKAERCGFSVAADKISQPRDMTHFVEKTVLLGPKDSDGDGIYDYQDQCPNSKANTLVNFRGCEKFSPLQAKGNL
jgi:hypothetical protein